MRNFRIFQTSRKKNSNNARKSRLQNSKCKEIKQKTSNKSETHLLFANQIITSTETEVAKIKV